MAEILSKRLWSKYVNVMRGNPVEITGYLLGHVLLCTHQMSEREIVRPAAHAGSTRVAAVRHRRARLSRRPDPRCCRPFLTAAGDIG